MMVSQAETSTLKDTLCAQQKLLQQLYNELEAEREASATAASEALSVILRLQGEKAAVKMEAEQYKRLAEEKMEFAEESFAIIEDMITEKEMEVAELDYQVQTYRYQLMSMGFNVPAGEHDFGFQKNDCLAREASLNQLKGKMAMIERESSACADLDMQMGQEINEFASDLEKKADVSSHEGITCFAGRIKDLQLRVEEIAGANNPRVLDVFEVPQVDKEGSTNEDKLKEVVCHVLESGEENLCKKTSDVSSIDHHAIVQPATSVAVAFVQPTTNVDVSESLNKLEDLNRAEEVKLLKEIREKLNALQDEIAVQKVKKSIAMDEPSLQPLAEVVQSFWL